MFSTKVDKKLQGSCSPTGTLNKTSANDLPILPDCDLKPPDMTKSIVPNITEESGKLNEAKNKLKSIESKVQENKTKYKILKRENSEKGIDSNI
ncbi:hypothetical protein CVS40_3426 [Lucilia cuprina]|nr:hypothetical protein CVS40_3426 [Lucilia cuprina]